MIFSKPVFSALVVGLGNPTPKYDKTRHNIGFMCIDKLAQNLNTTITKQKFRSLITDTKIGQKRVLLCKPLTFMNLSGEAVRDIISYYKIPLDRVIVISDDVSMDLGRLRIRKNGSHGGHNGLKNIIDNCGGDSFARVKIGVGGKPSPDSNLADWVLGHFDSDELKQIDELLALGAQSVETIITDGIDKAMNSFNR